MGRSHRGPKAVQNSLETGLFELGVDFKVDSFARSLELACVLSGLKTLEWAIGRKRKGQINKIVAGPNLVVSPKDYSEIICREEIDKIVVPSQWVKEFYERECPNLQSKIEVWAAGVEDRGRLVKPDGQFTVLYKSGPESLLNEVREVLGSTGKNYSVLHYGKYSHEDFFKTLRGTKALVYISKSESQGLALHEAWMAGVPTLVWNGGRFEYKGMSYESDKISAPYLDPSCGLFFKNSNEFTIVLGEFLQNYSNFSPRDYSLRNFTNKISAQKFLNILNAK
ncbi:MAG: glycosyltransferase [Candidatus Doudnabacteria bacterium]|nr:glycosyltransferase [Candidatus Doudnabacteria bacterium]